MVYFQLRHKIKRKKFWEYFAKCYTWMMFSQKEWNKTYQNHEEFVNLSFLIKICFMQEQWS